MVVNYVITWAPREPKDLISLLTIFRSNRISRRLLHESYEYLALDRGLSFILTSYSSDVETHGNNALFNHKVILWTQTMTYCGFHEQNY